MVSSQEQSPANNEETLTDSLPLEDNGIAESPEAHEQSTPSFNRKFLFIPLVIFIFATGGFVGLYFQPPGLQFLMSVLDLSPGGGTNHPIATPVKPVSEQSRSNNHASITALGTLLPLQELSILAPPYGSSDARIAQLYVQEGDAVTRGQVIATMDNLAKLEADVQSAQADVQVAQAQLAQIRSSVVNNRKKALAEVERIEANYKQQVNDLIRGKELKANGVITQAELDKLISLEAATFRSLEGAQANLANFNYTNLEEQTDVKLAASNLYAAQSKLNAKQQDLASATLRAPSDGIIISIHSRVGERPSSEGIATFGNTKQMQAKLEVYQSDIQYLQVGSSVSMRSDALGKEILHGKVSRIGLEVKKQQLIAKAPAANTDARVIIVNVELDEPSTLKASTLNGLEVIASIEGNLH